MGIVGRTLLLPVVAFLQAWTWEIRSQPPAVIGGNNHWLDAGTKSELEDKTLDILAAAGVAAGGTLSRDFRDTLAVLARGRQLRAYLGDIHNDRTGSALVSVAGPDAVSAIRVDDLIRIDPVPAQVAAERLVDTLPAMSPANLVPVAIPRSRYRQDGPVLNEHYEFSVSTRYNRREPTERPRELMTARRLGLHQLYAGESAPLTVIDVAGEGRVLTFVSEDPHEEPRINFLPGSRENVIHALRTR